MWQPCRTRTVNGNMQRSNKAGYKPNGFQATFHGSICLLITFPWKLTQSPQTCWLERPKCPFENGPFFRGHACMGHVRFWPWWVESLPGTSNFVIWISSDGRRQPVKFLDFFVASKVLVCFLKKVKSTPTRWKIKYIIFGYCEESGRCILIIEASEKVSDAINAHSKHRNLMNSCFSQRLGLQHLFDAIRGTHWLGCASWWATRWGLSTNHVDKSHVNCNAFKVPSNYSWCQTTYTFDWKSLTINNTPSPGIEKNPQGWEGSRWPCITRKQRSWPVVWPHKRFVPASTMAYITTPGWGGEEQINLRIRRLFLNIPWHKYIAPTTFPRFVSPHRFAGCQSAVK